MANTYTYRLLQSRYIVGCNVVTLFNPSLIIDLNIV